MEKLSGTDLPPVAIVVLNYRSWKETLECLESLQTMDYPDYTLIVVDNASGDESLEKIKQWAEGKIQVESQYVEYHRELKPVFYVEYHRREAEAGGIPEKEEELKKHPPARRMVLIKTEKNLGFSGGNNVGARYALKNNYHFLALLNPDTILLKGSDMKGGINFLMKNPRVGILAPLIFDNQINSPRNSYYYIPKEAPFYKEILSYLFPIFSKKFFFRRINITKAPIDIDKFFGCCFIMSQGFLEDVGLLDERTFLYVEEAILSHRARVNNYKIFLYPKIKFLHLHNRRYSSSSLRRWMESRLFFHKEYLRRGPLKIFILKIAMNIYKFQLELKRRWKGSF